MIEVNGMAHVILTVSQWEKLPHASMAAVSASTIWHACKTCLRS